MPREKKPAAGAPAWLVTFADLMSLLVCFFVLMISFSTQDDKILQKVSGSLSEAFGTARDIDQFRSFFEFAPDPYREVVYLAQIAPMPPIDYPEFNNEDGEQFDVEAGDIGRQGIDADSPDDLARGSGPEEGDFELRAQVAAETADQFRFQHVSSSIEALVREDDSLNALVENIEFEQTTDGLAIVLIDQAGGSPMFPSGGAIPYDQTRQLLAGIAGVLMPMSNEIEIRGHTDAIPYQTTSGYSNWELSSDRANAARRIMAEAGIGDDRIARVTGRASQELRVPDDPSAPANRRIEIVVLSRNAANLGRFVPLATPDDGG
jgi:chemotaxis protein MotB